MKKSTKADYDDYDYLEELRRSGRTNMFGAVPYLMKDRGLSKAKAAEVLHDWMKRYSELSKERGWRNE